MENVGAGLNDLKLAAAAANRGMRSNKFSQPSAVNEIDAFQIQQDANVTMGQKIANGVAKQASSFSERDFAYNIGYHGAVRLTQSNGVSRGSGSFHAQAEPVQDFARSRGDLGGI